MKPLAAAATARASSGIGGTVRAMKELVYHRQLLPAVERFRDKVGFHDGEYSATFEQHFDRVLRVGNALGTELGIGRGDRFAVMSANCHQYMELYHAGFLGCGVINPLNLRLAPKELAFILKDSGTKVVFSDFLFAPLIESVREEAGVGLTDHDDLLDAPHDVKYEDLVAAGKAYVPEEPEEDDPVVPLMASLRA